MTGVRQRDSARRTPPHSGAWLEGDPVGVREDGGVLDQTLREVVVRALPDNLPDHLTLDVRGLGIGESVTVADLVAPEGVTIVSEPETDIASVIAPTVEAVPEGEEAEVEEGAAPPAPEGEGGGTDAE